MKNLTSYFSRAAKLPVEVTAISISLWPPKGWAGARYPALAPSKSILLDYKQDADWDKYVKRYNTEILGKLDPKAVYADLQALAHGGPFALCCFEGSPVKCHRSLVARWLNEAFASTPGWEPIREFIG